MPLHPHGDGCSWPAPAAGRTLSQEETHLWGRRNGDGKGPDAAGAEGLLSPPDGSPVCGHGAFLTHFSWSSWLGGGAGGGQMQSPTMQLIPTHNTDKIQLQDAFFPPCFKNSSISKFLLLPHALPCTAKLSQPPEAAEEGTKGAQCLSMGTPGTACSVLRPLILSQHLSENPRSSSNYCKPLPGRDQLSRADLKGVVEAASQRSPLWQSGTGLSLRRSESHQGHRA